VSKINCSHCQLEFDKSLLIEDNRYNRVKYFCCNGCKGVFELLNSNGLDGFYDKIGNKKLSKPIDDLGNLDKFDSIGFNNKYIKVADGLSSVQLIIDGIHCSACVWLNEKVIDRLDGVCEVSINYTNHRAYILFDKSKIKLSAIVKSIREVGYNVFAYDVNKEEINSQKQKQNYFIKMMVAFVGSMNIMMLFIAKYSGIFNGMDENTKDILHLAEFFTSIVVLFFSGSIFIRGAYYGLKNRFINMDFLVSTGAILTFIYSCYAMVEKVGETYFDSVVMIITFVLFGKFLEIISKNKTLQTVGSIDSFTVTDAILIFNDTKLIIPVEDIKKNDIIEIPSGELVPIDGDIIKGESSFDYSALTGESLPIFKSKNNSIISGAINMDNQVHIRASKNFTDSTLSKLNRYLEESMGSKPNIEIKTNQISGYFSVVILFLSLFTFFGWLIFNDFETSLVVSISVIVIACPCALALATPMAVLVGLSIAFKNKIIFKKAKFLETMAKTDTIVLDKTGTLTEGKLNILNFDILKKFDINILYSLVSSQTHPVSVAICDYLKKNYKNLTLLDLENIQNIAAKGISANFDNKSIICGNREFLNKENIKSTHNTKNSEFLFAINGELLLIATLEDSLKKDAKDVIKWLKINRFNIIMLTGDNKISAENIAKKLAIKNYKYGIDPIQKAKFVENLRLEGNRVIMVGDGINDAPSFSKSDISISMGNGSRLAIESSDIILLDNSLSALKNSIKISKITYKFIKQNLLISLAYNLLTIPLAMFGLVIPLIAAISMSISSLIVVANSIRIKYIKL
jgi:Cu+-exporting ATPase